VFKSRLEHPLQLSREFHVKQRPQDPEERETMRQILIEQRPWTLRALAGSCPSCRELALQSLAMAEWSETEYRVFCDVEDAVPRG